MRLRPSSLSRSLLVGALALTTVLTAAPAPAAVAARAACFDPAVAGTVEEQRLGHGVAEGPSVPAQILARSGFDQQVSLFNRLLCAAPNKRAARLVVRAQAEVLWRTATHRAQHPQTAPALPPTDDRGLYWARISMALALRQWQPSFGLSTADRAELIRSLEYSSRGITSTRFTPGVRKILVTGFDPFTLDADIRIGNPSGAAARSARRWSRRACPRVPSG